ncbi:hypothetical protein [Ohtaekwangia koreensis]|uniref:Transglutaminase-like superfamily protein n=1 Tax=Ohtaekwangia koreensis TaxID=688867 RepID=A0A1T5J7G0_9BACT|nr:hypothetical protein [Ohtaekwangia koreensis]SKC47355.1 hypothetical protein SAMN05660236_0839 [Ohtaekwangia koreensis]
MESNERRRIKSGREFDHLFPKPTGKDHRVKKSADVKDTLNLIRQTVPMTLWQTESIAKELKGKTLRDTCENIWHFVYDHIRYKRDKDGVEQIRSPRRTWYERDTGVDCDCYSEFISSILLNLGIPHSFRITKYPKEPPEAPTWQHIYPIVAATGNLRGTLSGRDDYIVMDCVKDAFDDEQPFLECKDYDMRLDYLDGIDDNDNATEQEDYSEVEMELMGPGYREPETVDLADIASVYDGEEMGNIFKKIGKAVKKVADVHKKIITKSINVQKNIVKKVAEGHKKVLKAVAKKGVHFINRFTNPGTILLRNGFLLGVKLNIFNIGGRVRYAYLTDAQAMERGINMDTLAKVRKIKDKAEKIYYDAGGNKSNFKKAVLKGKGNKKHNPVPLNGLGGFDDTIYADEQEYRILHGDGNNLNGLGEIATGAAIVAALGVLKAVAGAFKSVKGMFKKGGSEEASFQSETDNAASVDEAKSQGTIAESEDEVRTDDDGGEVSPSADDNFSWITDAASTVSKAATAVTPLIQAARSGAQTQDQNETTNQGEDTASYYTPAGTAVPDLYTAPGGNSTGIEKTTQNLPAVKPTNEKGIVQKTTAWIKDNPGKSVAIGAAIAGSGYLLVRSLGEKKYTSSQGMSGIPHQRKKSKHKKKRSAKKRSKIKAHTTAQKIKFTKLL